MSQGSVILLGVPDSGKTNYIARLWPALGENKWALVAAEQPRDISFVQDMAEHLFQGRFAPRSEITDGRRDFEITVASNGKGRTARIVIPDISGEMWLKAVVESELTPEWMSELQCASGAIIFVRVQSDQNVRPLDWVTAKKLLAKIGQEDRGVLPTQVVLCELIRYLELKLAKPADGTRPRLSVVVSAWDIVDGEIFDQGPEAYLKNEYPLLAGKLQNTTTLDVRIFGLSLVGGDLGADDAYREAFLERGLDGHGWVATYCATTDRWLRDEDLTLPVAWVIRA